MFEWRTSPVDGFSDSTRTPISIDVFQEALTVALNVTTSITWTGTRKSIRSIETVTTRPRQNFTADTPAASSTSRMIVPPWMLPVPLASVGPIQWASSDSDSATGRAIMG